MSAETKPFCGNKEKSFLAIFSLVSARPDWLKKERHLLITQLQEFKEDLQVIYDSLIEHHGALVSGDLTELLKRLMFLVSS